MTLGVTTAADLRAKNVVAYDNIGVVAYDNVAVYVQYDNIVIVACDNMHVVVPQCCIVKHHFML